VAIFVFPDMGNRALFPDPHRSGTRLNALKLNGGQKKNYPIFWEGKGKGNPQLKKNETEILKRNFQGVACTRSCKPCDNSCKPDGTRLAAAQTPAYQSR